MTVEKARMWFGLHDTDEVTEEGLLEIIKSNRELLKVWSITPSIRKSSEQEIEACNTLLRDLYVRSIQAHTGDLPDEDIQRIAWDCFDNGIDVRSAIEQAQYAELEMFGGVR